MKRNVLSCLLALAVVVVVTGCGSSGEKKAAEQQSANSTEKAAVAKTGVKVSVAELTTVENKAEFTSSIKGYKVNNIVGIPARIEEINVEVGDEVEEGQTLAVMDRTQYTQASLQLADLEADFERLQSVYKTGGISKQQLEKVENQLTILRTQIATLKKNTELKSPIKGVVTARYYDPGDMFTQYPVLQVMQIDRLKVVMSLSEQYYATVKEGAVAEIAVNAIPGKVFNGKVSLIYPAIDPVSRTFNVEVTIPNPKKELRPGMFSRTSIKLGSRKSVVVEDYAVQKQPGTNERYLFVAKNGKAERRLVKTGIQMGNKLEILSGVAAGEMVITAGISKLQNGSEIELVK